MATETTPRARQHTKYYAASGTLLPGVTTILGVIAKPALINWANRMGLAGIDTAKHVDSLAGIGTLAHAMIAAHLTGTEADTSDYSPKDVSQAENACLSFFEWTKGREIKTTLSEHQMVSEQLQFGGTCDWYGALDGNETIIDLKTGRGLYDEHTYQLAAYAQLLTENGFHVKEARLLRVGRTEDEGFEEKVFSMDALAPYFGVFRCALNLYVAMRETQTSARAQPVSVARAQPVSVARRSA